MSDKPVIFGNALLVSGLDLQQSGRPRQVLCEMVERMLPTILDSPSLFSFKDGYLYQVELRLTEKRIDSEVKGVGN